MLISCGNKHYETNRGSVQVVPKTTVKTNELKHVGTVIRLIEKEIFFVKTTKTLGDNNLSER